MVAGRQAWEQAEQMQLGVDDTLLEVYLAMYGALLLARERAGEPVH